VLGVVLLVLMLSYIFPVRFYLAQQAEIAALQAAQDEQRAHLDDLAAEAARWADDDYLRIQARKRLYFGEPGELLLITVRDDDDEASEDGPGPDAAPPQPGAWWDTLWASVESANAPDQPAP
jgi:cell division protein FtsB